MARIEKKQREKQAPLPKTQADESKLWPHLPEQLINSIAWDSTLMQQIFHKCVTKSWKAESKKCISNFTLPWLQLSSGDCDNSDGQFHSFNIDFKTGCYVSYLGWRQRGRRPLPPSEVHFLGSSQGLLVAKRGTSNYILWEAPKRRWWCIPPWDAKVPLKCAVLSSSPKDPLKRSALTSSRKDTSCYMMVLTGNSHPAFAFCEVGRNVRYGWIKQDCNIIDPNCSNPFDRRHFMRFTSAIGFEGKFYALSLQGTLAVIEVIDSHLRITGLAKQRAVPSVLSMDFRECLLESDGEILLVFLVSRKSINIVDGVEIWKLDIAKLMWAKMESLEDRTLFLGADCCMSVSTSKVGCRKNCIYFNSVDAWWVYDMKRGIISPACSDSRGSEISPSWAEPEEGRTLNHPTCARLESYVKCSKF